MVLGGLPLGGADVDAGVAVAEELAIGNADVLVAQRLARPDGQAVEAKPLRGNVADAEMVEMSAAGGLRLVVVKQDSVLARGFVEAAADEVEMGKLDAARPDAAAFDALLHENVLVPLKQEQFIAFRHHILFDYAASRVYLRPDDVAGTASLLGHGNGLGLMLAPALAFALQQLWNDTEGGHRRFWDAVTILSGDPACDPVARSVAARTASELLS